MSPAAYVAMVLQVELVLTAHPTQATRRTLLRKYQAIFLVLPAFPPSCLPRLLPFCLAVTGWLAGAALWFTVCSLQLLAGRERRDLSPHQASRIDSELNRLVLVS
jgi:hypothetical protein